MRCIEVRIGIVLVVFDRGVIAWEEEEEVIWEEIVWEAIWEVIWEIIWARALIIRWAVFSRHTIKIVSLLKGPYLRGRPLGITFFAFLIRRYLLTDNFVNN